MWEDAPENEVSQLPEGIDGLVVYNIPKISSSKDKAAALSTDGRKWKKSSMTQWKKYGPMRYSNCFGSFKCENIKCPFRIEYGVINRTQFKKNQNGEEICRICEKTAALIPCNARRYVREGKKGIKVFHLGTHSCPVISKPEKPAEKVREMFENDPSLTPIEVQSSFIISSLRKEESWDLLESKAAKIVDRKWISNQKQNVKKEIHSSGENFEAVVTFKLYCDAKDDLFVYKVNDRRGNPDVPSFVFKTSKERMRIALQMNKDGDHFLSEEFCYFDGKVKRCRNFVTLTASTYHPLLKKQTPLAIMETEGENSQTIELFWSLFNQALRKAAGDENVLFNPKGWCTDMAGANMNGLQKVFGDDVLTRIKSCEFHFKESRNKVDRKLGGDAEEEFKDLCDELLTSSMKETYIDVKVRLDKFIQEKEERHFIQSWLNWWDSRRSFIFNAFSPKDGPKMNLAEVIHAGWSIRDSPNLSLIEVAQIDAKDSILLAAELKAVEKGSAIAAGQGPSFKEKEKRKHHRELGRAVQLEKDILNLSGYHVDPKSGHSPPNEKNKNNAGVSKKKSSKRLNQQPKETSSSRHQQSDEARVPQTGGLRSLHDQSQTMQSSPTLFVSHLPGDRASSQLLSTGAREFQVSSDIPCRQAHPSALPSSSHTSSFSVNQFLSIDQLSFPVNNPHHSATSGAGVNFSSNPFTSQYTAGTTTYRLPAQPFSCNVVQQPLGESWHSGYSPHRYELVTLPPNVRKCYGCGQEFCEKYRQSPFNIVFKHVDRRLIRRDERTGQFQYSADFSNTYYHMDRTHILRKNPLFNGKVYISAENCCALDAGQAYVISTCNLDLVV